MSAPIGWTKEQMAEQVISLFPQHCTINLGIGMPTAIAEQIPSDLEVFIHSENGVLGVSGRPSEEDVSPTLINAGKETIAVKKGASFFDSATSFGMIRGGHIDFAILGGMEVDVAGSLANWMVPGKRVTGMGGAMDLVNGAGEVIVMMKHFTPKGVAKLVEKCQLPLTGMHVVSRVVTDLGCFVPKDNKFHIEKLAPEVTIDDLKIEKHILHA